MDIPNCQPALMDGCSRCAVGVGYLKVPRPAYQLILTVVTWSGPQLTSLVTSPVTPEIAMPYVDVPLKRCDCAKLLESSALQLIPIYFLPSVLLMCRAFCYPLLNMKRFEIQAIVGKIPRLLCQLRLLYKDFRPSRGHWNISMV